MHGLVERVSAADLGRNFKDVEANIAQKLREWLVDYEFIPQDMIIKNPMYVSRAKSAMQKAIRRNNPLVAVRMADELWSFDYEVPWRRMAVLAFEEIGVADPTLVACIIWVCGKRGWREANGGCLNYLHMLVDRICRSVKDRSVCDLVCWADWGPDLAEKRKLFFGNGAPEENKLQMMVADPTVHLADRMLAGWALTGTKKARGENVPPDKAGMFSKFMDGYQAHAEFSLPPAIEMMCRLGINKTGDPMPVAYPLIWDMLCRSSSIEWEADVLIQSPPICGYPSEAFDQYCREGKRAIRLWNRECQPIATFLEEYTGMKDALDPEAHAFAVTSILVFRVEGSQVDRRLMYDGSKDLFDIAELALNSSQGCPAHLNDYAMELVRLNMPSLHDARCKVLGQDTERGGKNLRSSAI